MTMIPNAPFHAAQHTILIWIHKSLMQLQPCNDGVQALDLAPAKELLHHQQGKATTTTTMTLLLFSFIYHTSVHFGQVFQCPNKHQTRWQSDPLHIVQNLFATRQTCPIAHVGSDV
jgi:hypothetical protein